MQLRGDQSQDSMEVELVENSNNKVQRKRLTMHKLPLTCICIDSKNQYAFTASKDGSIIKWCLEVKKMLAKIDSIKKKEAEKNKELHQRHHVKYISAIAISSDDKFLATGGWDKYIRIWSPIDMTWLHTFSLHRQEITALAFRHGHQTLYSGSSDRSVMIWSLEDDDNRCFVEALYGHESPITSMDSLRKERILTSGGLDQSIRVWKIVEQAQTVFQSQHKSVDVARLIDDKTFVSGGEDGAINVWTTMKRSPLLIHHNAHGADGGAPKKTDANDPFSSRLSYWISSIAAFPIKKTKGNSKIEKARKKRKLDDSQDIVEYDFDSSEDEERNKDDKEDEEQTIDAEGSIALIASGSCDSKLRLWNLVKMGSKYELKQIAAFECPGFINDLRFTSDGSKILAACGQEHRLGRWWRLGETKNCMRIFETENKC